MRVWGVFLLLWGVSAQARLGPAPVWAPSPGSEWTFENHSNLLGMRITPSRGMVSQWVQEWMTPKMSARWRQEAQDMTRSADLRRNYHLITLHEDQVTQEQMTAFGQKILQTVTQHRLQQEMGRQREFLEGQAERVETFQAAGAAVTPVRGLVDALTKIETDKTVALDMHFRTQARVDQGTAYAVLEAPFGVTRFDLNMGHWTAGKLNPDWAKLSVNRPFGVWSGTAAYRPLVGAIETSLTRSIGKKGAFELTSGVQSEWMCGMRYRVQF